MGLKRTEEFREDAVRIALTSGLTRKQEAHDLGVGMSTPNLLDRNFTAGQPNQKCPLMVCKGKPLPGNRPVISAMSGRVRDGCIWP